MKEQARGRGQQIKGLQKQASETAGKTHDDAKEIAERRTKERRTKKH